MTRHLAWAGVAGLAWGLSGPPAPAQGPAAADTSRDLVLAAASLERGEETAAVAYLTRYVRAHPQQLQVRGQLAELLWRRDRLPEARAEYEAVLRDGPAAAAD